MQNHLAKRSVIWSLFVAALVLPTIGARADIIVTFQNGSGGVSNVMYTTETIGGTLQQLTANKAEGARYDLATDKFYFADASGIATTGTDGAGWARLANGAARSVDLVIDRYSTTPKIIWYDYAWDYIKYSGIDGSGITDWMTGISAWSYRSGYDKWISLLR